MILTDSIGLPKLIDFKWIVLILWAQTVLLIINESIQLLIPNISNNRLKL